MELASLELAPMELASLELASLELAAGVSWPAVQSTPSRSRRSPCPPSWSRPQLQSRLRLRSRPMSLCRRMNRCRAKRVRLTSRAPESG